MNCENKLEFINQCYKSENEENPDDKNMINYISDQESDIYGEESSLSHGKNEMLELQKLILFKPSIDNSD